MPGCTARTRGNFGLNAPVPTFACLRIAGTGTNVGAWLATEVPGSALVGSVAHRPDDDSEFQGSIELSYPIGSELPGRVNAGRSSQGPHAAAVWDRTSGFFAAAGSSWQPIARGSP
jgi:hypothetical protein